MRKFINRVFREKRVSASFDSRQSTNSQPANQSHETGAEWMYREMGSLTPDRIYHYTSSASLISIISRHELWLSDATFLNDKEEIILGRELARDRLQIALAEEKIPKVAEMLKRTISIFEERLPPQVYIACFSFEADDLSQWRAYGGTEAPVAIEFNRSPLMLGNVVDGIIDRVRYTDHDQKACFDETVAKYISTCHRDIEAALQAKPGQLPVDVDRELPLMAANLYHDIWQQVVLCKHQAFAAEREIRYVYTDHKPVADELLPDTYRQEVKPLFRSRAGRIVPFLKIKMLPLHPPRREDEPRKLPIRSVKIGPTPEPDLIERGVRMLLDANGYNDVEITHSSVPFRSG
ncbi:DUF2971 domain-containing protein (plasmid) [Thioclava sp. 'Guangxiensis']|uniref:DUF2971 domain-containing protein n=1 Tax=Thioclava sp. 'Guangxiensis' TaxID=3149044 RepID=UPI0032C4812A